MNIDPLIWQDFVKKSIELLKPNGFLSLITPSGWRDVDGMFKETQKLIKSKKVNYLEIHSMEDFSISRLKSKMPWGIPVPGDDGQVMYVWFDALVNYVSAVGWPDDFIAGKDTPGSFEKWCIETGGMVQYCGKDNLRQQSAMWQAMLLAAGLPTSKTVVVDGFVTADGGVKMSKSLGNTVDPVALVKEFGTDAMRYYCLRELHPFEDSPCTVERFKDAYNANLANGLGNLVSRVMKMAETSGIDISDKIKSYRDSLESGKFVVPSALSYDYITGLKEYNLKKSMDATWSVIAESDKLIQVKQPFKLVKSEDEKDKADGKVCIENLLNNVYAIGIALQPFMPTTSKTILECLYNNKMPTSPLFLRK